MAYNILKDDVEFSGVNLGTIEDMVDDHRDQSIGGVKTFTDMVTASAGISASVYYGDGSSLSGISVTPGGADGSVQFYDAGSLGGDTNFTYDGTDVTIGGALSASFLSGSGENVYNLQPDNISGTIGPSKISYGAGLRDLANNLEINLDSDAGLQVDVNGLKVYTDNLTDLTNAQLAIEDQFLVYDDSATTNKKFTVSSLNTYLNNSLNFATVAAGQSRIQYNDADDLASSANLTFNDTTNTLSTITVSATNVSASSYISSSTYYGSGQDLSGIHKIGFSTFTASFNVGPQQSIAAINTSGSIVTASLGSASDYDAAQPLTFKDIAGSASVNNIVIEPSGSETIDGSTNGIKIELDYGSVTISSDGVSSFYIIGTN